MKYLVILNDESLLKCDDGTILSIGKDNEHVEVNSLLDASIQVRKYIERKNLGSSCFTGGDVYYKGIVVAHISYNGRAWDLDNNEIILK